MADTISEVVVSALHKVNSRFGDLKYGNGEHLLSSDGTDPKNDLGANIIDDYIKAEKDNDLASRDALTGLHNRRYLEDVLVNKKEGAIAFIDIDRFKEVNDIFGHHVGDKVLREVSRVISEFARPGDTVVRYGGEEFILFFPRVQNEVDLERTVERIRAMIEEHHFKIENEAGPNKCTVSIGATRHHQDDKDWNKTISRADKAMYLAKQSGRNQVRVS